jgi:hypothetical protein
MNQLDDEAEVRLRAVLDAEASTVGASDSSLDNILDRAHDSRGRSSWIAPAVAAAAAVAVVGLASALILVNRPDSPTVSLGSQPPGLATTNPPTTASSVSPTTTASQGTTSSVVPVYFAASYGGATRLYREYHPFGGWIGDKETSAVSNALNEMLAGPTDPDYRALWSRPAAAGGPDVTIDGSSAHVTMPSAPAGPVAVAIQEIVYTVTGADPAIRSVSVSYPGGAAGPVGRTSAIDVLGPVWVTSPQQNAVVDSPVLVSGYASVFEATVTWQVTLPDGTPVTHGNVVATISAPSRGTWSFRVPLPQGHYVIRAFAVSPKDGSATWPDTKSFTVKH